MSATKQVYLQGERVTFTVADSGYSAAQLQVGGADTNLELPMTLADGRWTATVDTKTLSGAFRFAIFADGALAEEGAFSVRVLVSKYRAIVEKIDETIREIAISGTATASLSAGGGSQSYTHADIEDLQKTRASYLNMAVAEENGVSADDSATPMREDMWL
jgi:hypothetical protein